VHSAPLDATDVVVLIVLVFVGVLLMIGLVRTNRGDDP
jgi:hypothetical protein